MNLHLKSPGDRPGVYALVQRGKGLRFLSFTVIELGGNLREHRIESGDEELSLDFYTGPVRVEVESASGRWSTDIPVRSSIAQAAPMVYIPSQARVKLTVLNGGARITIAGAEGRPDVAPSCISAADAMTKTVGKQNWTRTVYTHIADNVRANRLICGETINRPGGWSSCPPHKHDRSTTFR
jgi:5-deoxy-glucuronate isomerase